MSTTVMDYVIKSTAKQLGINENEVKLDTVIPDFHQMAVLACMYLGKALDIDDLQAQYTVERAIEVFEE